VILAAKFFLRKIANKRHCSKSCRYKCSEEKRKRDERDLNVKSDAWKEAVCSSQEEAIQSAFKNFELNIQRHHEGSVENLLSLEEFACLITSNCYYCNATPAQKMSALHTKNGIDRLDCNEHYVYENCVPCCWTCNRMKGKLSETEFLEHAKNIVTFAKTFVAHDTLSLADRVALYNNTFPEYPSMTYSNGWIVGNWCIGACYKGSGYHGAYPYKYLSRIRTLFPEYKKDDVLHLFSGSLSIPRNAAYIGEFPGITFDINKELNPDVVGDATQLLTYFPNKQFGIIIADAPYAESDALKYGYPMIKREAVVKQCAQLLKRGGFLIWLDQVLPMYSKLSFKRIADIMITSSTNHRARCAFIYQKL
jgi:5-methylcytosine-specific restriction endonuclease McrA